MLVEVSIDDFIKDFLQSFPEHAPLKDLQYLIDSKDIVLAEEFPEINQLDLLQHTTRDEREVYPLLVCSHRDLKERNDIH